MSVSLPAQIRQSLGAAGQDAERIAADAQAKAMEISGRAANVERNVAAHQLARLRRLKAELKLDEERAERARLELVETMAIASLRLLEEARGADYGLPPWRGIGGTVELKLSETREITLRFAHGDARGGAAGRNPR